ncbi:NUDIX domain-containing protein [Embleya sp. NPDC050493]|uniref:NUDIX domain-containing protein n=1 Tax=Embleya sp. NPDC050493 TaxID=3363989 RepID=UPI00378E15B4
MTNEFLPPEQWYAQLPTLYAAASALITDAEDRVLLVKPNYRDYWNLPGGFVDRNEPPHVACAREIREELGLDLHVGELLVIDWVPELDPRPRPLTGWMFDGGTLTPEQIAAIRIQEDELDEYAFVTLDRAAELLPSTVAPRVPAAVRARALGRAVYLPRPDPTGPRPDQTGH